MTAPDRIIRKHIIPAGFADSPRSAAVTVPADAWLVYWSARQGGVALWFEALDVDDSPMVERRFRLFADDQPIPPNYGYRGSVEFSSPLVTSWVRHIYEADR